MLLNSFDKNFWKNLCFWINSNFLGKYNFLGKFKLFFKQFFLNNFDKIQNFLKKFKLFEQIQAFWANSNFWGKFNFLGEFKIFAGNSIFLNKFKLFKQIQALTKFKPFLQYSSYFNIPSPKQKCALLLQPQTNIIFPPICTSTNSFIYIILYCVIFERLLNNREALRNDMRITSVHPPVKILIKFMAKFTLAGFK